MKVIVDMDNVLADFVSGVLKRWNKVSETNVKFEDIKVWWMEEILGTNKFGVDSLKVLPEWMREKGFFLELDPIPEAIWGFNKLQELGHDVIVATSIPEDTHSNAYDDKRWWMKTYFPNWPMKNFIACCRKGLLKGDALIDDGEHNIKDWAASNGLWFGRQLSPTIIFDAPWNQKTEADFRVYGWHQIVALIESLEHERKQERLRAEHGIY